MQHAPAEAPSSASPPVQPATPDVASDGVPPVLLPGGHPISAPLPASGASWRLPLEAGQCAVLVVHQQHADVRLEVLGPEGDVQAAFDTPDQDTGSESLRFVAQASGPHRVRVLPQQPRAHGSCQLHLVAVRPASPEDRAVMEAQRRFMDAEVLRRTGTGTSQRQAAHLYEQAIPVLKQAGERIQQGVAQNSLAITLSILGEGTRARRELEACLAVRRAAGDPTGEAQTLSNLGVEHSQSGAYREALELHHASLRIRERVQDGWGIANSLTHLGMAYASLGELTRAEAALRRATASWRERGDDTWELLAGVEHANVLLGLGRHQEAQACYARARELKPVGRGRIAQANALNHFGHLLSVEGRFPEAIASFKHSLQICRDLDYPLGEAVTQVGLAGTWTQAARALDGQERAQALQVARRAGLQALLVASRVSPEVTAHAHSVLMHIFDAQGHPRQAIFCGMQAVDGYQRIRQGLQTLERSLQEGYLAQQADTYRSLARLLVHQGQLPEAELVLRMLKAEEYFQFLQRSSRTPLLGVAQSAEGGRYQGLLDQAASLARQCEDMRTRGLASSAERRRYLALKDQLAQLNEGLSSFFDALRTAAQPRNHALQAMEQATASVMADLGDLGPDVVAVHTLLLEDEYIAMVVTPQARIARTYRAPDGSTLTRAALRTKIADLRLALQRPALDPRPRAQALYNIIVGPIAADLHAYRARIILWFLDGELRYVPMAALHDGTQYLVESYRSVICTLASLPRLKETPRATWRALGLGVSRAHEVRIDEQHVDQFPALANVAAELGIIRRGKGQGKDGLFDGEVLLDAAFTAAALREALLPGAAGTYPLVHIASHFRLMPGDVSRSYLLLGDGKPLSLSWFNQRGDPIFRGVDLLTLSACDTATGSVSADGIAVEGFAELAQQQGARAVLATLWPVADASTSLWMQHFYRQRTISTPKVEALRQAQLALLHGRPLPGKAAQWRPPQSAAARAEAHYTRQAGDATSPDCPRFVTDPQRPFAHPYHWAPFVLFGNSR